MASGRVRGHRAVRTPHHDLAAAGHDRARAAPADLGRGPGHVGHGVLVGAGHGGPARADAGLLDLTHHGGPPRPGRETAPAGASRRDPALRPGRVGELHRRAQRADDVLLPRAADRPAAWHPVLLPGERRGGHPVGGRGVVRDRAGRPRGVPVLQLRRPVDPFLGPQRLGEHLARVVRQRLLRGERDREPGRRRRPAAVPSPQRRPVLRQPGHPQCPRRVAGLRRQHRPVGGQPAVDASPGQPRNRVRRVRPRRAPGKRAGRGRGPGSGRELLERPVRLRPLPEPFPAAGQWRDQLGWQPPARQLLQFPVSAP